MASELLFPRGRHVALVAPAATEASLDAAARAEAGQALLLALDAVPRRSAAIDAAAIAPPTVAKATAPATFVQGPEAAAGGAAAAPRPPEGALPPAAASPAAASPAAAPTPAAAATPAAQAPPAEGARLPRMLAVDLSRPRNGDEACLDEDGARAGGGEPVRCPNSLEGRTHAAELAMQAAAAGDAVLLQGLARWYSLGPHAAGYCSSCEQTLLEAIRGTYGEHVLRFPVLSAGGARSLPVSERPFAGLREALRLTEPLEAAKRSVLRARDEARRSRGVEVMVFAETGPLNAFCLALCKHLDGLVFALPSADPLQALFPLLAARAALGERAAVAVAPVEATAAQVTQLSALAAACDTDLMLPADAAAPARAALAAQRRYQALVRERFRPSAPLADLDLFLSPRADHFSGGAHLKASALVAATLAPAHVQLAVRLDPPAGPHARRVLVLAGCEALPEEQASALRRHVDAGGDLLLFGPCSVIDAEGRRGVPLFEGLKQGLDRFGDGRIWAIAPQGPLPSAAQGGPLVLRAARELLGRGKQALTLSGRGQIFARAYLDPERKLDVHLVNLDLRDGAFGPAQGLTLHIAGQAAGGGRAGYWFAPERQGGRDGERIALNPSGFSVSTVLPSVGAGALLAVPR